MPVLAQEADTAPRGPGEMRAASAEERALLTRPGALFNAVPLPDGDAEPTSPEQVQTDATARFTGRQPTASLLFPEPEFYIELPLDTEEDRWEFQAGEVLMVRPLAEEKGASNDPFKRVNSSDDWHRTVGVAAETRLTDKAVVSYDSRLGMEGEEQGFGGEGDSGVTALSPSQRVSARVSLLPRLTVTGEASTRGVLSNDLDDTTGMDRNRREVGAQVDAWTGAKLRGDFREESDIDGDSGATVGRRDSFGLRLEQALPGAPLTATVATRLERELDPDSPDPPVTESRPMLEGTLTWKPRPVLALKVGVRRRNWDDAMGITERAENTWFAEHRQELGKRVEWLSRARYEDETEYTGSLENHAREASITVGPSFEISDTFNANLEMRQSWAEDNQIETWAPAEQRISISISGEF